MNYPLVSIILPTYNGNKERLKQSIDSVLGQSYKNFELIIINDASTNNIEGDILTYQKKDKRIVYIKNKKNLKLTRTLNKGIERAKGKYIARIDDDDIRIDKNKLEKQVDFMEHNVDYGLCGAGVLINIDGQGESINEKKMRLLDYEIREDILKYNQFAHSSIIMRKSLLDEVGVYNPNYNRAEDYELWCRIGTKSKFRNIKDIVLGYRINPNGVSRKNAFIQKTLSLKICIKYRKYYPNFLKALLIKILLFLPRDILEIVIKIKHHIIQ